MSFALLLPSYVAGGVSHTVFTPIFTAEDKDKARNKQGRHKHPYYVLYPCRFLKVNLPKDHVANTHRGFGFIEFEMEEDAKAAVDNMDGKHRRLPLQLPLLLSLVLTFFLEERKL